MFWFLSLCGPFEMLTPWEMRVRQSSTGFHGCSGSLESPRLPGGCFLSRVTGTVSPHSRRLSPPGLAPVHTRGLLGTLAGLRQGLKGGLHRAAAVSYSFSGEIR